MSYILKYTGPTINQKLDYIKNATVLDNSDLVDNGGTVIESSNSIDILSDIDASSPNNEQILKYNSTSGNWEAKDPSSGGGLPQLLPDLMSLDDTNTGSSRGTAFSMIQTIDFASGEDGSVWITFNFISALDASKDLNLDIYYNLSGSDDNSTVEFQTEYWCKGVGETPSASSPTGTNNESISTGTGEDGSIRDQSLNSIPSADISAGDVIILKFTRLGSNASDDYSGTFQLINVIPSQP